MTLMAVTTRSTRTRATIANTTNNIITNTKASRCIHNTPKEAIAAKQARRRKWIKRAITIKITIEMNKPYRIRNPIYTRMLTNTPSFMRMSSKLTKVIVVTRRWMGQASKNISKRATKTIRSSRREARRNIWMSNTTTLSTMNMTTCRVIRTIATIIKNMHQRKLKLIITTKCIATMVAVATTTMEVVSTHTSNIRSPTSTANIRKAIIHMAIRATTTTKNNKTKDQNNNTTLKVSAPAAKKATTVPAKDNTRMKTTKSKAIRTEQEETIYATCARPIWRKLRRSSIRVIASIRYAMSATTTRCRSKRGSALIVESTTKLGELRSISRAGWLQGMKGRMRTIREVCNIMRWHRRRRARRKRERIRYNMPWNGKQLARYRKINRIKRR